MNSDEPKKIKGNQDSKYELPAHESHLVHVSLDPSEFDPRTGKRISEPKIQKFRYQEFLDMQKVDGFSDYKVEVLHDPSIASGESDLLEDEGLTPEQKAEKKAKKAEKKARKAELLTKVPAVNEESKTLTDATTIDTSNTDEAKTEEDESKDSENGLDENWDKGFKKADYQAKYKELYKEDAEESETIDDLKTAITEFYQP